MRRTVRLSSAAIFLSLSLVLLACRAKPTTEHEEQDAGVAQPSAAELRASAISQRCAEALRLVASHDFLPTLLEYVDLPLPDTHLPGQSFLLALKDEHVQGRDAVVIFDEYGYCRMIRTQEWKSVHRYPDGPNELF